MKNKKQKLAVERRLLYLRNILRVIAFLTLTILGIVFLTCHNTMLMLLGIILSLISVYLLIYAWFYFRFSHIVFKYNIKKKYAFSNTITLEDIKYHYEKYQEMVDNIDWNTVQYTENGVERIALISPDNKYGFTFTNGLYHILDIYKDRPWATIESRHRSRAILYDIDRAGIVTITGRTKIPVFFNWFELVTSFQTMKSIGLVFRVKDRSKKNV